MFRGLAFQDFTDLGGLGFRALEFRGLGFRGVVGLRFQGFLRRKIWGRVALWSRVGRA